MPHDSFAAHVTFRGRAPGAESSTPRPPTRLVPCSLLLAALLLAGCQTARVDKPLTATLAGNEPGTQMEFWHQLTQRPVACNDEAFHGLLLFLDGRDDGPKQARKAGPATQAAPATQRAARPLTDYDGRVGLLKARGLLPSDFADPPDQGVKRGTIAVALVRALQIKGGLVMRLLGPSPRYALREMEYLGMLPASSPRQTLSGEEFVAVIGRAEDFHRGDPAEAPATVMPGELERLRKQQRNQGQAPTTRP